MIQLGKTPVQKLRSDILFCVPFVYFFSTRLRHGSPAFHLGFEWGAAFVLIIVLSPFVWPAIGKGILCYLAFISIYEIGYLFNDIILAPRENGGRERGSEGTTRARLAAWIIARLLAFTLLTATLGYSTNSLWWSFYSGLVFIFFLHNTLTDRELKSGTFLWLSWFRFMAPIIFVVPQIEVMGISFACAMSYSSFRLLGYLDSKKLLAMPGRKRTVFRVIHFFWPLAVVALFWNWPAAHGGCVLLAYYATVAAIGGLIQSRRNEVQTDSSDSVRTPSGSRDVDVSHE